MPDATGVVHKVFASQASTAWLNAAIACSNEEGRGPLYRTISVEFFKAGIQFVGCDGTMLFRTWAPFSDAGDMTLPQPSYGARPKDSVVVFDEDKFGLGFMKTLASAADEVSELAVSIEPVADRGEPPLGKAVQRYVLTLRALEQTLSLKLYEGEYPNWRRLSFGIEPAEQVEGMLMATKLFRAVGKLIGVTGIDCTFKGDERAIEIRSRETDAALHGLLMPMRRLQKPEKPEPKSKQADIEDED